MKRINLKQTARNILTDNQYMTLGTVNPDGKPWVSPVVYFYDKKWNLYFMSLPGSRHCQNILENNILAVAIFDSHQDLGQGVGLQIEAEARVAPISETVKVLKYSILRKWPYGLASTIKDTRRFMKLYNYRFYKITPTKIWLNDPRKKTDERVRVRI